MDDSFPEPKDAPAVPSDVAVKKPISPAAGRALAEAASRRAERAAGVGPEGPEELRGRGGLDPVRYGDWEVKGIASDF
jgi:hypothetical protein